ncbi:hypothetical protein LC087_19095 (plasmid) [Bacillus carboniphilus]|uniref:Uncharacterized protein n=1 Tax=Bacillus carboniphilus TaxID=86663 RepID=A0ABY9K140_9BACI|nr:hypothetical protein [Bacillus carboniphilus]WLR44415.1 hypothetical protein LC087_19095 [Bacillus carboniphilus]
MNFSKANLGQLLVIANNEDCQIEYKKAAQNELLRRSDQVD